jgi:hypothetical protein
LNENPGGTPISEITHFIAMPFDFAGRDLAPGEPAKCASPAAAIERAQITVLRTFGSVPEDFEA